jgi:putative endonuclease
MAKSLKQKAYFKGHWAEFLATLYLRIKGYRILAKRFKTKAGEVDVIVQKGDVIAMIEVKARADEMAAINSVTAMSQRRIMAAGDIWLGRQRDYANLSVRYDIIAILPWKMPKHFKDAF